MSFIRAIFKWLAALVVAYLLLFLLVMFGLSLVGLAFSPQEESIEPDSVLVFNLDLNITDTPSFEGPREVLQQALQEETYGTVSLLEVLDGIRRAADDDRISGIVITGNGYSSGYGSSIAAMEEVRKALQDFKQSGKPLWAYMESEGTRELFVKSVADQLYMNPFSYLEFKGLASETAYLGDFLGKYGVEVQVARSGKFKSAAESLSRGQMSPEERTQRTKLLEDIWAALREGIGSQRKVDAGELASLADSVAIFEAEQARDAGLVDDLLYRDEMSDKLVGLTGRSSREMGFRQINMLDYVSDINGGIGHAMPFGSDRVAIVYAEGVIVEGPGVVGEVGADTMVQYLRDARLDPFVKAVVMRVNSPGGSATASEKILRELRLTADVKPVVVSMGGLAASGGYWISSMADTIFAEPTTITGSIGVISMIPNVQGLAQDQQVNFEGVRTSRFADLYSISRPRDEEEMDMLQKTVDKIYQDFLTRVSEGRDMPRERVNEIAQGRVWSGRSAIDIGLVDQLGGLEDAVAYAAKQADMSDYSIRQYPERVTFETWLEQSFGQQQEPGVGRAAASTALQPWLKGNDPMSQQVRQLKETYRLLSQLNDPMGVYAIEPNWVFVD
ncbi:MAG: signal peptide peptidase SppA [Puniceicoccaceae bacterium 5H]|nr:MAG: signal peptide peptidase SppA [Puniceicoccaceae bacterium 5H]